MSGDSGRIKVSVDGPVAVVVVDRPHKLNAIDPSMLATLESMFADLDRRSDVRVVILTGSGGRAFSVGADIDAWADLEPMEMWRRWVRDGNQIVDRIASVRQPVIAAVNGFALGGGLELALAADIRVCCSSATFGSPEVRVGTVPGWGGSVRLPEIVGKARATHLVLTGSSIDAVRAEQWGLVTEVVPDAELMERAGDLARKIADNSPVAVELAKQMMLTGSGRSLHLEALAGGLAKSSRDAAEGIRSFREKRSAEFEGT